MFLCPKCGEKLQGFHPQVCVCGYSIPYDNNIYRFADDASVNLDKNNMYISYDEIGENFEPVAIFGNVKNGMNEAYGIYGMYGACGLKVAEIFGCDIVALDLGAGLGTASVPLASAGIKTIAVDISEVMLATAVKRAKGCLENLVCARMNAYGLHIADGSIDIVIENAMLHLVDNPEAVIREIIRVLKPKGYLIRYGSRGIELDEHQQHINQNCRNISRDISDYYYERLTDEGYQPKWFDNHVNEIIPRYFELPYSAVTEFEEVFTDRMKFDMYKLQKKAHSDLVHVPWDVHKKIWELTEDYACKKFGADFRNIPGYSKYGAVLEIYRIK